MALAEPRLRARGLRRADDATPAAVLWDMDGTLVDTEPYWIESEYELVEEHGGTWSHEHAMNLVGNDLLESGRYIARARRHRPRPGRRSSRSCSTGSVARVERDGALAAGRPSSCSPTCGPTACAARW